MRDWCNQPGPDRAESIRTLPNRYPAADPAPVYWACARSCGVTGKVIRSRPPAACPLCEGPVSILDGPPAIAPARPPKRPYQAPAIRPCLTYGAFGVIVRGSDLADLAGRLDRLVPPDLPSDPWPSWIHPAGPVCRNGRQVRQAAAMQAARGAVAALAAIARGFLHHWPGLPMGRRGGRP